MANDGQFGNMEANKERDSVDRHAVAQQNTCHENEGSSKCCTFYDNQMLEVEIANSLILGESDQVSNGNGCTLIKKTAMVVRGKKDNQLPVHCDKMGGVEGSLI
ncbi:hypothetical protein AMTR_s00023p00235190 [Amborella trichopoda]|uniref:Uncharacterized protein n=1 Tax=Amborella trichopoda TaxID=13333 RepID=W1NIY7_AMBTC|nr:hypothetical protein AMTR_s00023p00235190 [Amborella trichopoda]